MTLANGARLGPYEIVSPLGAGGMGEVYRARDTKLDRDVAIKVLPEAFAHDTDRLARFEREAKTLATLNHPNIAHIYGLEETTDVKALILELVEGPTLADRIAQGPIPLDEALSIAIQIAEALEAAHESGVIHRDLKPANIKLRPGETVKVLDFGLAKLADPVGSPTVSQGARHLRDLSQSPTITSPAAMTMQGVILGTAAYMAPEQRLAVSRGLPARDVWIHEGRRATTTRVTTDAANDDSPVWTPDGQRIVFTSNRDVYGSPTLYWQRADGTGEAERLLTLGEGSVSDLQADDWSPDGRKLLFTAVPVAENAGDIGIMSMDDDRRVDMLTESEFREGQAAISRDGNWMAYHSNRSGQFEIYVERFPDLGDRQRVSIRGGRAPRWSPDGTALFYLSLDGSQMWAVPIIGGPTLAWETPRILFEGSYLPPEGINRPYDIAPDGQRFVVVKLGAAASTPEEVPQLVVVRDWFSELKRLVPVD